MLTFLPDSNMPLHQSEAIILKTYPLGEADRIVVFFSRAHGKFRGVANGARKMKNRFGAALEPLAHSRIIFAEKENRELVRIQSADLLESSMKLFEDYDRALFAGHMVDLMDRFLPDHEPQDAVFRLAQMTRQSVVAGCPVDLATGYFELWMLRLAGVLPNLLECHACGAELRGSELRWLERDRYSVACEPCAVSLRAITEPVAGPALDAFQWILRNRLEAHAASGLPGDAIRQVQPLAEFWIRNYLER